MTELCIIAFVSEVRSVAVQFQALPENISSIKRIHVQKSFHFLCKPHVMLYISWIKDICAFTSMQVRSGQWFHSPSFCFFPFLRSAVSSSYILFCLSLRITSLSHPPLSPACSAAPASVHSLHSKGSETVTQSSLVIGHGHANQTGRNLQLIRILPPAIIVPRHRPPPPSPSQH